jgi:hypothetical protein
LSRLLERDFALANDTNATCLAVLGFMSSTKDQNSVGELEDLALWAVEALTVALVPPDDTLCCLDSRAFGLLGTPGETGFQHASIIEQFRDDLSRNNRPHLVTSDAGVENLAERRVDGCVTFGALDSAFADEASCESVLRTVARLLCSGGKFFGLCVDSASLWTPLRKAYEARQTGRAAPAPSVDIRLPYRASDASFCIAMDPDANALFRSAYGHVFTLGVGTGTKASSRKCYLVNFGELIRVASRVGLEYREALNLKDFWEEFHRPLQYCEEMRSFYRRFQGQKFRPSPAALEGAAYFSVFVFEAVS